MPSMDAFRGFQPPPALDLLAEFRKKFIVLAERRTAELRVFIDQHCEECFPSAELQHACAEYESLRHFEQELNRVISAFMEEARKPMIELLCRIEPWNTSTLSRPPILGMSDKSAVKTPPAGDTEP